MEDVNGGERLCVGQHHVIVDKPDNIFTSYPYLMVSFYTLYNVNLRVQWGFWQLLVQAKMGHSFKFLSVFILALPLVSFKYPEHIINKRNIIKTAYRTSEATYLINKTASRTSEAMYLINKTASRTSEAMYLINKTDTRIS